MPTVKEIKAELDAEGVEYPPKANKHDLEALLAEAMTPRGEPETADPPAIEHEDRPRNIKAKAPEYIDPEDDFIDPNAQRPSQAQ